MKKKKEEDKLYKEALLEWRKEHFKEIMDKCKATFDIVLEKKDATDRNKIEAAKNLARMIAGLKDGKEEEKTDKKTMAKKMERELSKEELVDIKKAINNA